MELFYDIKTYHSTAIYIIKYNNPKKKYVAIIIKEGEIRTCQANSDENHRVKVPLVLIDS